VLDYVPDEQSGYFYDENASAHQSEDAYEEFIEEAKLLLAGDTPINPEACQPPMERAFMNEPKAKEWFQNRGHTLVFLVL
jgi:hypothetical protein